MTPHFEYKSQGTGTFDPRAIVTACIENGSYTLLLDSRELPREFFDLSTGVTGELVQRLSLYAIRMACVVPDPSLHSCSFQDFVREANKGQQFRFFRTREEAFAWLDGAEHV